MLLCILCWIMIFIQNICTVLDADYALLIILNNLIIIYSIPTEILHSGYLEQVK